MRIVFLSRSKGWGGLERNLQRYALWMQEAGHEIEINAVPESPLATAVVASNLPLRFIPRQRRYLPVGAAPALKKHLLPNRYDVLWIRDPRDLPLAAWAVRGLDCALIFQQGMQIPTPKKAPWHRMRFAAVNRWVSPLHGLRDEALRNTPLKKAQTEVIALALEDEWFDKTRDKKIGRIEWGLPERAPIIGLFGRIDPLKGQADLLRALAEPEAIEWHAFIIGENTPNARGADHQDELKELAVALKVADRVHWRPPANRLAAAYDCCDAYAMCSVSETFGMVTIEALARQIPIIGTNTGGTPELLANGRFGKLYAPGHHQQLAQALNSLENWPMPSPSQLDAFRQSKALERWQQLLRHSRRSAL